MKKKYKVSLITLIAAFLAAVLIAVCLFAARPAAAFADDRYPKLDGSSIFYTSIRGAAITSGKEGDKYFTVFKIGKGENEKVSYRKSLAYEWITGEPDEKGNPTKAPETRHFSICLLYTNDAADE